MKTRAKVIAESINKPLTPFIASFALVVLLTVMFANLRPPEPPRPPEDKRLVSPRMELSPFSKDEIRKMGSVAPTPFTGAAAGDSPDVKKLFALASKCLDDGDLQEAEDKLRTILVFTPDNPEALHLLGTIFYRTGRYKEAEFVFRRQAEISPDNSSAYNNLGTSLAKQKKYDEAIRSVEKGLQFEPESPSALLNLSGIYSVKGDTHQAIEYFKRAYERLGERILPLSYDPTLDNIRNTPEFKDIIGHIGDASAKRGAEALAAPDKR